MSIHRKTVLLRTFLVTLLLFQQYIVFSQATDELLTVKASGFGRTTREAEADALRAAVQQAVGVYVSSETMTQDEDLIADKILTASNGIVKDYKAEPPAKNAQTGLYEVRIEANVLRRVLLSKLDENKISYTVPVSGNSLFAQAQTMKNRDIDAESLFTATLDDLYSKDIGKMDFPRFDRQV